MSNIMDAEAPLELRPKHLRHHAMQDYQYLTYNSSLQSREIFIYFAKIESIVDIVDDVEES